MSELNGLITHVQRFCIHDGPGIRTTVFLKGCSLRCFWCHNPETWKLKPEIQYFSGKCITCGECVKVCPNYAHKLVDGAHRFDRSLCENCGRCAEACMAEALILSGEWWTVGRLIELLERDRVFYEQSGGGITLSGGEPLSQATFSQEVLKEAKVGGLHTAIETCLMGKWDDLEGMLPFLDLVIMDIKVMDDRKHREAVGASNQQILANARQLMTCGLPVLVRTPVIPGVNDDEESITAIAEFIVGFPTLTAYELMPFHRLGEEKFRGLGIMYQAQDITPPEANSMEQLAEVARTAGIETVLLA